jgi:hypothetical protein
VGSTFPQDWTGYLPPPQTMLEQMLEYAPRHCSPDTHRWRVSVRGLKPNVGERNHSPKVRGEHLLNKTPIRLRRHCEDPSRVAQVVSGCGGYYKSRIVSMIAQGPDEADVTPSVNSYLREQTSSHLMGYLWTVPFAVAGSIQ